MSDPALAKQSAGAVDGKHPQTTVAQHFSASLDELFKMDNSLAELEQSVQHKKEAVSAQTSELQQLEARLKATEERLRQRQGRISNASDRAPSNPASPRRRPVPPPQQRSESSNPNVVRGGPGTTAQQRPEHPVRVSSARKGTSTMPGALPPTPSASEDGEFSSEDDE